MKLKVYEWSYWHWNVIEPIYFVIGTMALIILLITLLLVYVKFHSVHSDSDEISKNIITVLATCWLFITISSFYYIESGSYVERRKNQELNSAVKKLEEENYIHSIFDPSYTITSTERAENSNDTEKINFSVTLWFKENSTSSFLGNRYLNGEYDIKADKLAVQITEAKFVILPTFIEKLNDSEVEAYSISSIDLEEKRMEVLTTENELVNFILE